MHDLKLMRLPDVLRLGGISRSTLYAMLAEQQFPPPVRIGRRMLGGGLPVGLWPGIRCPASNCAKGRQAQTPGLKCSSKARALGDG